MAGIVKLALETYALGNDKKWENDRSQTVGASEVGQCARKTYYVKNEGDAYFGADRDEDFEDTWGAKWRGKIFEDFFWYPAMKAAHGYRLSFAGPDQKTFKSGFLTATPDGLLDHHSETEWITLDCKSIDPRVNLVEPKPEHAYQVQVQMGLVTAAGFPSKRAILSYTNASDFSDIKEFEVAFDPAVYEEAQRRAEKIMTALSAADLQPEGIISGGKECDYCAFKTACATLRASRVPTREAQSVAIDDANELRHAAIAYRKAKDAIEDAEEVAAEAQEYIKSKLAALNMRQFKDEEAGVTISWSSVKGRAGWDNKAIRDFVAAQCGEEMLEAFKTSGDPSDRLTISVKK